jgi:hypothetical protein
MFTYSVPCRTSAAVEYMSANPITGVVDVCFTSGHAYTYTNVSRRAIMNLLANPNMSLGFWINTNCVDAKRVRLAHKYCYAS